MSIYNKMHFTKASTNVILKPMWLQEDKVIWGQVTQYEIILSCSEKDCCPSFAFQIKFSNHYFVIYIKRLPQSICMLLHYMLRNQNSRFDK